MKKKFCQVEKIKKELSHKLKNKYRYSNINIIYFEKTEENIFIRFIKITKYI